MKKVLNVLSTLCFIGGAWLILGTEGSSQIAGISISQILTQVLIGFGILFLGYGIRKVVL